MVEGLWLITQLQVFLASRVFCKPCSLRGVLKCPDWKFVGHFLPFWGMTAAKWAYDPSLKIVLLLSLLPLHCYEGEGGFRWLPSLLSHCQRLLRHSVEMREPILQNCVPLNMYYNQSDGIGFRH